MRLKRLKSIVLICISSMAAMSQAAVEQQINQSQNRASLTLTFPDDIAFRERQSRGNTVLHLNQPLENVAIPKAAKQLSDWAKNLLNGYDTLLVQAQPGINLAIKTQQNRLVLQFDKPVSAAPISKATPKADKNQHRRLQLLEGQLLRQEGKLKASERLLSQQVQKHPKGVDEKLELAQTQWALGKRRQAIDLHHMAHADEPDNLRVKKSGSALLKDYVNYVKISPYHQSYGDEETINSLHTDVRGLVNEHMAVEVRHKYRRIKENQSVTRLDGSSGTFAGNRQQVEVRFIDERAPYGNAYAFVTYNGRNPGIGVHGQSNHHGGTTWGHAAVREAWMELPAALIDYGHRDRLAVGHDRKLNKDVSLSASAAVNRYGLDGLNSAAKSWEAQAGLRYQLPVESASVDIGYGIDKEHAYDHAARTDNNGNSYHPLDVSSSEIHNLDLTWWNQFTPKTQISGQLGFGNDRKSGNGPFASVNLIYEATKTVETGLNANYSNTSSRSGNAAFQQIGAYVKMRMP